MEFICIQMLHMQIYKNIFQKSNENKTIQKNSTVCAQAHTDAG